MNATNETDTFFAPTDAAIDSFTEWGGFNDTRAALQELFGDVEWKGYIIAYHAVPDVLLTREDLASLEGDDRYVEDALLNEMPLLISHNDTSNYTYVIGLGSKAEIVEKPIRACNGILHMVDTVLLPFDGDDKLSPEQLERLDGWGDLR